MILIFLPHNINIHLVAHVEHTRWVRHQPVEISNTQPQTCKQFVDKTGEVVIEVERIVAHKKGDEDSNF